MATFVAVSAASVVMSAHVAAGPPILARRWTLLAELAIWAVLWAAGVAVAFRLRGRVALALIVGAGLALRLAAIAGPPVTSDDLYRYGWDGRAQVAGVDPYAHAPASPALTRLREPWLWPGPDGCADLDRPPGCTRINRPEAPTIYPPAAEAWFGAVYRTGGGLAHQHKPWQVAGLVTETGVLALLPIALRRFRQDARWTALYALSPAPVVEIVNNGHVDGLAVVMVVTALVVAGGRWRHRDLAAGVVIGLATLVKLFPIVLLVALAGVAGVGASKLRTLVRAGAAAGVVIALGYAPHVAGVGWRVAGYVPGYAQEEGYDDGGRFLLAGVVGLDGWWAAAASLAALAAAVAWVLRRDQPAPVAACTVLGTLLLVASPVQSWYAVLLLAAATVAGMPAWSGVVVAGYPYFFAVILDASGAATIGRLAYGLALVAPILVRRTRRRSSQDPVRAKAGSGQVLDELPLGSANRKSPTHA